MSEQPIFDFGPWLVGEVEKNGKVYLESDDFVHDVRLYVDGDFADVEEKLRYAHGVARQLNQSVISMGLSLMLSPENSDNIPEELKKACIDAAKKNASFVLQALVTLTANLAKPSDSNPTTTTS